MDVTEAPQALMVGLGSEWINDQRRPSLEAMLEDYWRLMPQYQNIRLQDLEVLRILFGFFPTYRYPTTYLAASVAGTPKSSLVACL